MTFAIPHRIVSAIDYICFPCWCPHFDLFCCRDQTAAILFDPCCNYRGIEYIY